MNVLGEQCRYAVLSALDHYRMPASSAAVNLLCMIAAHESSGFRCNLQIRGPAISMFQMEPMTYMDICRYVRERPIKSLAPETQEPAERMVFSFQYAVGMARAFFLRKRDPLPGANDIEGLSEYSKTHWNTFLGEATAPMYANAYRRFFA